MSTTSRQLHQHPWPEGDGDLHHAKLDAVAVQVADQTKPEIVPIGGQQFAGFIGASAPMLAIYRAIEAVAPSMATVFITGESGTGKEVAAEAIHRLSHRRGRPFVAINCGAIPKDLIESELFGHLRGSFTGAVTDRVGAIKHAHGGTLFLDEICEMNIELQSKLLRFLQSGVFVPVGSNRSEKADIRVICATNRNPLEEVRNVRFREDLYYRLHVVPILMPPLRGRGQDVVTIARELLCRFAREESKLFYRFSDDGEAFLLRFEWPGNVRQLQNVLRNVIVMNEGDTVTEKMLRETLASGSTLGTAGPPSGHSFPVVASSNPSIAAIDLGSWRQPVDIVPLSTVERATIERAIAVCSGNIPRAAALLGVSASTIYRKKQAWDADPSAIA